MSAYVIVEIDIADPAGYEEYKKQAAATVHKYGGKYIVRKEWLNCEEYREPRKMRHRTAKTKMILVEGV
ncbi:MAG: hypothetical protein DME36_04250 [Verrucomicrobia bacterium]|nr:MAG: hypothetical protein DME36_04250 [Verrucomicrobiota bacterium]